MEIMELDSIPQGRGLDSGAELTLTDQENFATRDSENNDLCLLQDRSFLPGSQTAVLMQSLVQTSYPTTILPYLSFPGLTRTYRNSVHESVSASGMAPYSL